MTDTWSPSAYLRFQDERTRPAGELLARVPLVSAGKVVDVGCGPGNSTALLAARYPDAEIVGVDSSPAMLAAARQALPRVVFVEADAETWLPDVNTDLVFSNSTYQWIPDHVAIFQRILACLPSGAVLAVQMPDNLAEPAHRLMRQIAADGPWTSQLADTARAPILPVRTYYDALRSASSRLDIWQAIYNHVLEGPDAVVEWMRGTALRPFLDPLPPDHRIEFLRRYRVLVADAYPLTASGEILLRFTRLFFVAVR